MCVEGKTGGSDVVRTGWRDRGSMRNGEAYEQVAYELFARVGSESYVT